MDQTCLPSVIVLPGSDVEVRGTFQKQKAARLGAAFYSLKEPAAMPKAMVATRGMN